MDDLIFIMTRCVRSPEHNRLYIECYKCIRAFYTCPIYIIDDKSDRDVLIEHDMSGVTIIQSEFPGAGELLPYYYMYHKKLGKKAVILHDSMFIQKPLDLDIIDYKFLWHFPPTADTASIKDLFTTSAIKLNKFDVLYDIFYDYQWNGCFGSCMIITLDFLNKMQETTQFLSIIPDIVSRIHRCMLERFISVVCYSIHPKHESLLGSIFRQFYPWGITYEEYKSNKLDNAIVKVWNSR